MYLDLGSARNVARVGGDDTHALAEGGVCLVSRRDYLRILKDVWRDRSAYV